MDTSCTAETPDFPKKPPYSTADSNKPPLSLVKTSGSQTKVISKSSEDILRRLHRHPSISAVKKEMIEFEKGSGSRMGIEVVAGDKTPHRGALVIKVFPDCIAGLEEKLRCGDEILEVSGRSIIGMSHSEVISLLKESTGLVTMLVSRSSQVLDSHNKSETSLLDDFYATEKLSPPNTPSTHSNLKSSADASLHSIRHEDTSEDELDDGLPTQLIQQSYSQGSSDDVIIIQHSASSILSTGPRTSVTQEEISPPPLPSSSPPVHKHLSPITLHMADKETEQQTDADGPPVGYSVVTLEIQKISKGKLTIVPCQKTQEGYFMVSWLIQCVWVSCYKI